jgi:hypothetical protein
VKMTPQMPAAAIWLLKVFKVTESNQALAGDLAEEYSGGQRTAWVWRQVFAATAFTIAKEIFSHKLLTVRAVMAGEAAVLLSYFALIGAGRWHWFSMFWISVFTPSWLPFWSEFWILYLLRSMLVVLLVFTFGGWIVGRLHRDHRATFVVLFATLQSIVLSVQVGPTLIRHLIDSIDQPRFRSYLALDLGILFLSPIAVLLGGYIAGSRADDRCPRPQPQNG